MLQFGPIHTIALPRGDTLTVAEHGAHALSWRTPRSGDGLYLTPLIPSPGAAIRGGVPVCFPQFANRGPLPKHGFARTSSWQLAAKDDTSLCFELRDSAQTQEIWPGHAFQLQLALELGHDTLQMTLTATNTGNSPWAFTGALHTYVAVRDVARVRLEGLQGLPYEDALDGGAVHTQGPDVPDCSRHIDRVYRGAATRTLRLHDDGRVLEIRQDGWEDTVVWNPAHTAPGLGDMPPEDAVRMLCVEAAQAARPVTVEPGQSWTGRQQLAVVG